MIITRFANERQPRGVSDWDTKDARDGSIEKQPMIRSTLVLTVAAVAMSGAQMTPLDARPTFPGMLSEDLYQTLDDRAVEAGTSAGIAAACGTGATPVGSAFSAMLDSLTIDRADKETLWQRYKSAQASAIAALLRKGAVRCADAKAIVICMIHGLARPTSLVSLYPVTQTAVITRDKDSK